MVRKLKKGEFHAAFDGASLQMRFVRSANQLALLPA
jgi:hypothetical protein